MIKRIIYFFSEVLYMDIHEFCSLEYFQNEIEVRIKALIDEFNNWLNFRNDFISDSSRNDINFLFLKCPISISRIIVLNKFQYDSKNCSRQNNPAGNQNRFSQGCVVSKWISPLVLYRCSSFLGFLYSKNWTIICNEEITRAFVHIVQNQESELKTTKRKQFCFFKLKLNFYVQHSEKTYNLNSIN